MCLGVTAVAAEGSIERERTPGAKSLPSDACLRALVDNVRSAWNVGSIFRSAEGFGLEHLYLCGITPTPDDQAVKKTALDAQGFVRWSAHRNAVDLGASLKEQGHALWVLEHTPRSVPIESVAPEHSSIKKTVLVVGNEQVGVDPGLIAMADRVVHLDMRGHKRSFNVAVAFAIAANILRAAT